MAQVRLLKALPCPAERKEEERDAKQGVTLAVQSAPDSSSSQIERLYKQSESELFLLPSEFTPTRNFFGILAMSDFLIYPTIGHG